MECPYCQHKITDADFRRLRGQYNVSKRKDRQPVNAVSTKSIPAPKADSVRIDKGYDFGA